MSDKLNIGNEMRQLDLKNRGFYDSLDRDERKKFSTFLMLRWSSAVEGSREIQEYYVQSCNHYLNKRFFDISKHPKLQWLCATAVSPGMGAPRHNWIAPKKKEAGASTKRKALQEIYPTYKDDEIDVMMQIVTQKEIDAYFKSAGHDKK
jgi:hypothetical protein